MSYGPDANWDDWLPYIDKMSYYLKSKGFTPLKIPKGGRYYVASNPDKHLWVEVDYDTDIDIMPMRIYVSLDGENYSKVFNNSYTARYDLDESPDDFKKVVDDFIANPKGSLPKLKIDAGVNMAKDPKSKATVVMAPLDWKFETVGSWDDPEKEYKCAKLGPNFSIVGRSICGRLYFSVTYPAYGNEIPMCIEVRGVQASENTHVATLEEALPARSFANIEVGGDLNKGATVASETVKGIAGLQYVDILETLGTMVSTSIYRSILRDRFAAIAQFRKFLHNLSNVPAAKGAQKPATTSTPEKPKYELGSWDDYRANREDPAFRAYLADAKRYGDSYLADKFSDVVFDHWRKGTPVKQMKQILHDAYVSDLSADDLREYGYV